MADSDALFKRLGRREGVTYAGLVLNRRGFERAMAAGVEEIHFSFGVTESFNRKNQNAAPDESAVPRVVARVADHFGRVRLPV
ncbi:MAG: hypothetical protein IMW86_04755 [Hydrogenibacillus sp.]|nr:hypothetical protein [Hydrogenibacillus sp.]